MLFLLFYKVIDIVSSGVFVSTIIILSIVVLISAFNVYARSLSLLGIKASGHYLRQVAVTCRRGTSVVKNLKFLTPFSIFLTIKLYQPLL